MGVTRKAYNYTWPELIGQSAHNNPDITLIVKISVKISTYKLIPCLLRGKQDIPVQSRSGLSEDKRKQLDAEGIFTVEKIHNLNVLLRNADPEPGKDKGSIRAQCEIYDNSDDLRSALDKIRAAKK